ncbi:hypothetical protein HNY73_004383 [Argiope bruennichi]|uniref:Uncharacterized protein n=1 Tax=Argiope bruennichi TaxID=94029 RepID=A0A8T0FVQ8_ARGBR|nr:hypothetical protein HNY73_004383 [Argiope bruennichi]
MHTTRLSIIHTKVRPGPLKRRREQTHELVAHRKAHVSGTSKPLAHSKICTHLVNYANPNGARPFDELLQFAECRDGTNAWRCSRRLNTGGEGLSLVLVGCSNASTVVAGWCVMRSEVREVRASAGTTRLGRENR